MEFVIDAFIDALKIWPLLVIVYVVFEFMGNQRTTYLKIIVLVRHLELLVDVFLNVGLQAALSYMQLEHYAWNVIIRFYFNF